MAGMTIAPRAVIGPQQWHLVNVGKGVSTKFQNPKGSWSLMKNGNRLTGQHHSSLIAPATQAVGALESINYKGGDR